MLLKGKIQSYFKLNGLVLKSGASEKIVRHSETHCFDEIENDKLLSDLLSFILDDESLTTSVLDDDCIERALKINLHQKCNEPLFQVYDVFSDLPKLIYDSESNKLRRMGGEARKSILGQPDSKAHMFNMRYHILYYRLSNSKLFSFKDTKLVLNDNSNCEKESNSKSSKFQIMPVIYLIGCAHPQEHIICLGMLTSSHKNELCLEDPTGCIKLDISETSWHEGIFTQGCFVLAEGSVQNNVFHAFAIGLPPIESHEESLVHLGDANLFASVPPMNPKVTLATRCVTTPDIVDRLAETNEFYVILSDLHLDIPKVQEKFDALLKGYESSPPVCFILCGSFVSPQSFAPGPGKRGPKHVFQTYLTELAHTLKKYPNLIKKSKFVFVPHLHDDIGLQDLLPRPPIPASVVKEFYQADHPNSNPFLLNAPDVATAAKGTFLFATNPCRIQHRDHQIVVYRHDIVPKMFRNSVHTPPDIGDGDGEADKKDLTYHFCQTILSQCHLSPLPLTVCPRYWEFEDGLMLYPLPDLIVCADKYIPYDNAIKGCTVLNPGSFSKGNFAFKVYYPFTRATEDSAIP